MRAPRTLLGPVVLLVVLAGVGCAPLEPKSKKAEGAATPTASPSAKASTPTASPTVKSTARPQQTKPSIKVPKIKRAPKFTGPVEGGTQLAAVPQGDGDPGEAHARLADAAALRQVRDHRPHQRAGVHANPCLASQVNWVKSRRLLAGAYAVNSYPNDQTLARYGKQGPFDSGSRLGALSNVGYQQAN